MYWQKQLLSSSFFTFTADFFPFLFFTPNDMTYIIEHLKGLCHNMLCSCFLSWVWTSYSYGKLASKMVSISIPAWAKVLRWCYGHHWVRLRGVNENAEFSSVMPLIPRSQPYLVALNYIFRYVFYSTIQYTYFCTYVPEHMYTITHVLKAKRAMRTWCFGFFLSMRWTMDHSLFW